jgi:hypothetical protein
MTLPPGPVGIHDHPTDAGTSSGRWGWVGGLTVVLVSWQLVMYAKSVHLTWHGYDYGEALSIVPLLLLIGLLAPLVSYRRRDALFLLVPIWNVVVAWRIGSRLTRIACRDWPHRPDELTGTRP